MRMMLMIKHMTKMMMMRMRRRRRNRQMEHLMGANCG